MANYPINTKEQQLVEDWNQKYPLGTPVRYWTGVREGEGKEGKTRTEASLLSGHSAVVWVTGQPGCISLSHVEPIEETD